MKYLRENTIPVRGSSPTIRFMEDISYIKSKAAGNYRFNPFCDAVEIFLKNKNNTNFDKEFQVVWNDDSLQVNYKKYQPKEWSSSEMKLTPNNSIRKLIEYVCKKRQSEESITSLVNCLEKMGAANTIQDLYGWERSDYTTLGVKPTFIFEIQEIVGQVKDNSRIDNGNKYLNDRKKQCIKTANSHKILRYCVYTAYGIETVKKIAWINRKNLMKAI
jgi:hypothetical protein